MWDSIEQLRSEHGELQLKLADPAVHQSPGLARKLNRRYLELDRIVTTHNTLVSLQDDLAATKELAAEDDSFGEEIPALEQKIQDTEEHLRNLLIPKDPDDGRDVIMEIKGGEGGEESALFAADLLRMYLHYAESRGWKTEVLDSTESDMGGYKNVQVAIKSSSADPSEGVWARLKYEGGVHRVQRVPTTESQGRIHTSTTGVLVFPEVDEPEEVDISQNDLKIDVFRASGPGGQSVNTTDSAVRITHLPRALSCPCRTKNRSCKTAKQPCVFSEREFLRSSRKNSKHRRLTFANLRFVAWTAPSESAPITSRKTGSPTTAPGSRPTTWTR